MVTARRRRAWSDTRFAGVLIAESGTSKSDLLATLTPADTKTVTRIIGDIHLAGIATNQVEYDIAVDVGIGVVSEEAFDLETLPDPNAVADYPQQGWLYVATQRCYQSVHSTIGVWRSDARFTFDLGAQRKVDRGVLFMVISNNAIILSSSLAVYGRVRALCLT